MKTLIAPNEATIRRLAEQLKVARKRSEFQRIQCILIRATLGSSAAEIAQLLGWSVATVHMLHSRYSREGDALFDLKAKGGRRNQHMTFEEETEFLAPFLGSAAKGGILVVSDVQVAFEARIGKAVPPSTIYRLLARHDWRKIVPRPQHPKADPAAQAAFKKTQNKSR
jgi:transposase